MYEQQLVSEGGIMLGIIGAMNEEIDIIKNDMKNITEEKIGNIVFIRGNLYNHEVVLVESGIGKVNSSITATLLIYKYNVDYVLFSGVAGSTDEELSIGDVVIATDLIQHDMDVREFGLEKGQIPRMNEWKFQPSEKLLDISKEINLGEHKILYGRIISGDQFISGKQNKINLGKEFKALCVDMESASVAQVCYQLGKEFLIVRSISDSVTDETIMEYSEFVHLGAENSKKIIESLLKKI